MLVVGSQLLVNAATDIAVGNVIGSSLFNLMSVLGPTSIVSSDGIR